MSSVEDWNDVTQAALACPDADLRARLSDLLARLRAATPTYDAEPAWSDDDLARARAAAASLRGGVATDPAVLAALAPDDAGDLLAALLVAGADDLAGTVVASTSPVRYPVADLLARAAAEPGDPGADPPAALVRAVALAPDPRLARALAAALAAAGPAPAALTHLLVEVAAAREALAAAGPYRWWHERLGTRAEPPGSDDAPAAPEGAEGADGADSPDGADGGDTGGEDETVWRSPDATTRSAYARLDVASGTSRPEVVVVDQAFEVTLGLQARRDGGLVASLTPLAFAPGETVELDVTLLYDPTSISVTGTPRARIVVGDLTPYPSVTMTCTAQYGEDLAPERRLGLQVHRDGQVVAVAWRTLVAVASAADVDAAPRPPARAVSLLDLDPLLGDQPPDLVVSVCRADSGQDTFVWTAYAADPAVEVPDLPSASSLEGDVAGFALETRRSIQFSTDAAQDFLDLAGRARRIGRAVPEGIREGLRAVLEAPGRTAAPAVLLLTEELSVPWELAAFDPPLTSTWGGTSPFLGAHVAIARWPLTEHKPRPSPRETVSVHAGAVLTADYTGVPGWGRLESAVAEASAVAGLFDPKATVVEPEIWSVIDLFRGTPAADVVHVALHGQFDAQGAQEGIVLLATSPAGGATAQFLTPAELENGHLDNGPFVFLNACQVGSDERVLGDYGGFASTLLRIGATCVVAPLWNVRDDVAASFATAFYAATWTAAAPVSAAEAVRAQRATYTEAGVRAGAPGLHATLVAYQVFGHPRLRLVKD